MADLQVISTYSGRAIPSTVEQMFAELQLVCGREPVAPLSQIWFSSESPAGPFLSPGAAEVRVQPARKGQQQPRGVAAQPISRRAQGLWQGMTPGHAKAGQFLLIGLHLLTAVIAELGRTHGQSCEKQKRDKQFHPE